MNKDSKDRLLRTNNLFKLSLEIAQKASDNHLRNSTDSQIFLDKAIITISSTILLGGTLYGKSITELFGVSQLLLSIIMVAFGITLVINLFNFHITISMEDKYMKMEHEWWKKKAAKFQKLNYDSEQEVNQFCDTMKNRHAFDGMSEDRGTMAVKILNLASFYIFFFGLIFIVLILLRLAFIPL